MRLQMCNRDTPGQSRFQRVLDDMFPFSAYLAYSVRYACLDIVDVHSFTWAAVLVLFTVFALLHRFAGLILLHLMPIFIVGAFLLLFALRYLVLTFRQRVESAGCLAVHAAASMEEQSQPISVSSSTGSGSVDSDASKVTENFHERHSTELWVLRALQILLFVLSYACARTIGDLNDWRNRPKEVSAVSSAFLVLFILLGSLLPNYVPAFAALMALPPYCDKSNVETFFEVLDEYNTMHSNANVFDEDSRDLPAGSVPPAFLLKGASFEAPAKKQQHKLAAPKEAAQAKHGEASLSDELSMMRAQLSRMESLLETRCKKEDDVQDVIVPVLSHDVEALKHECRDLHDDELEDVVVACLPSDLEACRQKLDSPRKVYLQSCCSPAPRGFSPSPRTGNSSVEGGKHELRESAGPSFDLEACRDEIATELQIDDTKKMAFKSPSSRCHVSFKDR